MIIGVQIFGCSKEFRKDPKAFFESMKEAGILQIEPCILFDDPETFRENALKEGNEFFASLPDLLWLPHEVEGFSKMLKDMGMYLTSAHCFYSDLATCKESMIKTAKSANITSYVFNVAKSAFCDKEAFAKELNDFAIELGHHKIELWLHNLGEDSLQKTEDGKSLYLWLLENCENVYAQPDTGWLLYGGIHPQKFIYYMSDKIRGVHFKDLAPDFKHKSGTDIFAVLGEGCINTREILTFVKPHMSTVIDQDFSKGDFVNDLKKSATMLHYFDSLI